MILLSCQKNDWMVTKNVTNHRGITVLYSA